MDQAQRVLRTVQLPSQLGALEAGKLMRLISMGSSAIDDFQHTDLIGP